MAHGRLKAATVNPDFKEEEVYFFSQDKDAIEVTAATELNNAIKACRETILTTDRASGRLVALGEMLTGIDRPFTRDDRGNARQLCATVRQFAEAAAMAAGRASGLKRNCDKLRDSTRWACHPPLTKSRVEWRTHTSGQVPAASHEGRPKRTEIGYVPHEVTPATVGGAAGLLRKVVDGLISQEKDAKRGLTDAPLQWRLSDDDACATARAALDKAILDVKGRFKTRQEALGMGKHGQWPYEPASTLQAHAWLLFEAQEHLVASRYGSAAIEGRSLSARQLCLGLRMFAEKAGQAVYNMRTEGAEENNVYRLANPVRHSVAWAAHADTWPTEVRPGAGRPQVIDAGALDDIRSQFMELAGAALGVLDCFLEPKRRAVLDLAIKVRAGDWRAALYLGLCLKDDHKAGNGSPSADPAARAQQVDGIVRFHYPKALHHLLDSEKMLRLAEAGTRAAGEAARAHGQAGPDLEKLLDYDAVVAKELEYVVGHLRKVLGEKAPTFEPIPPREKRRVSKEESMRELGQQLLGEQRPLTAAEEVVKLRPSRT